MKVFAEARGRRARDAETLDAPKSMAQPGTIGGRSAREDLGAAQIRFRRALTAAYTMWAGFVLIDYVVVRNLDAGSLRDFVLARVLVIGVALPILRRLYRKPPPTERVLTILDLSGYTSAALAIGLMCIEFRGIASPYASGLCLVLLARMVTAQDPWRRGLLMSGIPVGVYYVTLLGSALFVPRIAAQLRDPAALTMLLLNSAYVLGTYVFLVIGGNVIWSLRRQVFEARALGRYKLKKRIASGGMGDVWVAYHPGLERDDLHPLPWTPRKARRCARSVRWRNEKHDEGDGRSPRSSRPKRSGSARSAIARSGRSPRTWT